MMVSFKEKHTSKVQIDESEMKKRLNEVQRSVHIFVQFNQGLNIY